MATASTITKLPLATFGRIVGLNPLHFEGVEWTNDHKRRPAVSCDTPLLQYDWQAADQVSREQIAMAIAEAEAVLERFLHTRLAPTWEVDEWAYLTGSNGGWRPSARTRWGNFISGGVEKRTLLQADSTIVWSDTDNDGYKETGTITLTVAEGLDGCEIEAYYPSKDGNARWQIRPITVSVAGTTATIVLRRELTVKEALLETLEANVVDGASDTNFLATVDVYRHWNDPSVQATLMWRPGHCVSCSDSLTGCSACTYSTDTGCLYLLSDRRTGLVSWQAGTWDADNARWNARQCVGVPEAVRLNYYAGMSAACRTMPPDWQRAVAFFALTFLERPVCECSTAVWEYWRAEGGARESVLLTRDNTTPLGTRRGALYAWNRLKDPDVAILQSTSLI